MESIKQIRQFVESLKFDWPNAIIVKDGIGRYIERIEDEHARLMRQAIEKAHADGERSAMKQLRSSSVDYQKGYEAANEESADMRDFCERLEEAAKKREDVTLFDVDYVALPVDEDGVTIRPGDIIDGYGNTFEVSRLVFTGLLGWIIVTDTDDRYIDSYALKHHKEQDVYEVLKELCERYTLNRNGEAYVSELDELVREYADRLELKEEQ